MDHQSDDDETAHLRREIAELRQELDAVRLELVELKRRFESALDDHR